MSSESAPMPANSAPNPGAGPEPATPEGASHGPDAASPGHLPRPADFPRPLRDHEPAAEEKIGMGDDDLGISWLPDNLTEKQAKE